MCQGHCDVMTRRKKRTRIVNSGNGESTGILQLFRQTYVWGLSHLFLFGMCADFSTIRFTDQPSNMGGVEGSVNALRLTQPGCDCRRKIKSAGSLRKY